ncbi:MAG: hypothetical protein AB2417_06370 [Clostridiaceae bacterium]
MNIDISYEIPNGKEYNNLRIISGLSPKDEAASEIGLKNSIFMVTLRDADKLVGMGRIIGDGGCMHVSYSRYRCRPFLSRQWIWQFNYVRNN